MTCRMRGNHNSIAGRNYCRLLLRFGRRDHAEQQSHFQGCPAIENMTIVVVVAIAAAIHETIYWLVWGPFFNGWSAVRGKRIFVFWGFLLALSGAIFISADIASRIGFFAVVSILAILVGNLPELHFIPHDRRKISSGKNIWEKILILFWY